MLSAAPNIFAGDDVSVTFEVISGAVGLAGARRIQALPKPRPRQIRAKGSLNFMCSSRTEHPIAFV